MRVEKNRLFKNTNEAIDFGEHASLEDMSRLVNKLVGVISSKMLDISFELQFYNEAYHAYAQDEWYQAHKRS